MNGPSSNHITIIPGEFASVLKQYSGDEELRKAPWLYLSKDAGLIQQLKKNLPGSVNFLDTGSALQQIAHEYRQDFIDFIGTLNISHHSRCWLATSVSEKNPYSSDLFLHFCYLILLEKVLGEHPRLVVVCSSTALIRAITDNFKARTGIVLETCDEAVLKRKQMIPGTIGCFIRKIPYIARYSSRILVARIYSLCTHQKQKIPENSIAIHSWTDARSFSGNQEYTDVYFGKLGKKIGNRYGNVVYIANILPNMFFPTAVLKLMKLPERVFLFEEFLSFEDILKSLSLVQDHLSLSDSCPTRLRGMQVAGLIRDELLSDRTVSYRSEICMLFYFAAERLSDKKAVSTLVYTFENHMWEKMLLLGLKKRQNGCLCRTVGYAHSVISPMYLFYSISAKELSSAPLPDTIIVNGPRAKKVLSESGFPDPAIKITGAFRYEENISNHPVHKAHPAERDKHNILITPPASQPETIEMIQKCIGAFSSDERVHATIKLHPTMKPDRIMKNIGILPRNFSFTSDPVTKLFQDMNLLLFTESAVSVEALACYIPVLRIRSDIRIDLDIFDGVEGIESASSPEEICKKSLRILSTGSMPTATFDRIVKDFFAPVDDDLIMEIFST